MDQITKGVEIKVYSSEIVQEINHLVF